MPHLRFTISKLTTKKRKPTDDTSNDTSVEVNENKVNDKTTTVENDEDDEVENIVTNKWRAFSFRTKKTYFASSRGRLWNKIKEDVGGERHWRRRNKWIVLTE